MVAETVAAFGKLDVLVANAGQALVATAVETTPEQWERDIGTNLTGCFLLARAAIPRLIAAGGGSIVLTASQLAFVGAERFAAYAASKGGVLNLARALALDHARDKIRVNALCPGAVETPLLLEPVRRAGRSAGLAGRSGSAAPDRAARAAGGDRRCRAVPGLGRGVVRNGLGAGGGRRVPGPLTPGWSGGWVNRTRHNRTVKPGSTSSMGRSWRQAATPTSTTLGNGRVFAYRAATAVPDQDVRI